MRTLRIIVCLAAALCMTQAAAAQEPPQKPPDQPQRNSPLKPPAPHVSAGNVRVELSIADHVGTGAPQSKTVSMLVAEGYMGRVRSSSGGGPTFAVLNVDATPRLQKDGRIALQLILEYRPGGKTDVPNASPINEMLTVLLNSGKALVVTQAADPSSERKVTVEVTATVLK